MEKIKHFMIPVEYDSPEDPMQELIEKAEQYAFTCGLKMKSVSFAVDRVEFRGSYPIYHLVVLYEKLGEDHG